MIRPPSDRSPAPGKPGAIDWPTHFTAIIIDIGQMQQAVELWGDGPDEPPPLPAWRMRDLVMRLRSRHIPQAARERFPEIPWHAMSAWLARENALDTAGIVAGRDATLIDFARPARSLVPAMWRLQAELEMTGAVGNGRDGVLSWDQSAAFVHMTLRVPAECTDLVLGALQRAYAGVEIPTTRDWRPRKSAGFEPAWPRKLSRRGSIS